MTALRCVPLVGIAAVVLGVSGALASGCTNGTTPTCDDAGTCLILANPTDGTVSTVTDAPPLQDGPVGDGGGGSSGGG
jgi:hypothetical protein